MKPKAFRTQQDFRTWLSKNHATKSELWMRLYKVHARTKGIGYREALDESLCWGWIDGLRRSLDADSFTQRFTPRKPKSIWSAVNLKRIKELIAERRVMPPGREALKRWGGKKAPYSFENRPKQFLPAHLRTFRANTAAWTFFKAQPPGYQRLITWFVMSAKREETREKRLAVVIKWFAMDKRLPDLAKDR